MSMIDTFIARMRYWCTQAKLGYSQSDRWNFNPDGGNCDCSSLVIHCLQEAGFDTGQATYTGNLSAQLTVRGWIRLPNNGRPQPGDILLNDADHVAVYLGYGRLAQASQSEYDSADGAPGDQTGGETNVTYYYNYPWDCYLRWDGEDDMPLSNDDINRISKNTAREVWSYIYGQSTTPFNYLTANYDTSRKILDKVGKLPHDVMAYKGPGAADGKDAYGAINQAANSAKDAQARIEALETAVKALTAVQGGDPTTIVDIVDKAVRDRLEHIKIEVTATSGD